jgi:MFS family permease
VAEGGLRDSGFRWLWASYTVSAYGSAFGFGALPLIAVLVLEAGPGQVSLLAAVGPALGALIALPLGPWAEARRKRPVMIAMDVVRFVALMTIPIAYALGRLGFVQLLVVAAVVAAARIAFQASAGAYLKHLVRPGDLLVANARFESANWSSIAVGPPLGGAAIGLFGPVTTVIADAAGYLLSAAGLAAIRDGKEPPRAAEGRPRAGEGQAPQAVKGRLRMAEVLDGWRHVFGHPGLRALYLNQVLVAGLIMATEPLLAVLMLGELGFPPWQYGLAFAVPCLGGLIGSRLARRVVARHGTHRILRVVGSLRAVWLIGLAFVQPGVVGLITVIAVELAIIVSMSLFNPVMATYRLENTPSEVAVRTLTAWSIGSGAVIALLSGLAGLLAGVTSARTGIVVAGLLILISPVLLAGIRRPAPSSAGDREAGRAG